MLDPIRGRGARVFRSLCQTPVDEISVSKQRRKLSRKGTGFAYTSTVWGHAKFPANRFNTKKSI
jgi:hypothetical protein